MIKNKGYTLIELLVVITIGLIIFTIGFAGYREFSRRQDLSGVSKNLISDLRLIQQKALTGEKPTGVTCLKLIGYTFTRTDSSTYTINASCDDSVTVTPVVIHSRLIKTVSLPTGITLTATTPTVLFKILGLGTDLSADNTLTLTNTYSSNTVQIVIGKGGGIQ